MMKPRLSFIILFYMSSQYLHNCYGHTDLPKLLLVSFDGFRADYLDLVKRSGRSTPNFDRLIKNGVQAAVKTTFVTKTFPNHYTIATGLYEENHGVVQNNMYDPVFNEVFSNKPGQSYEVRWWNNGTDSWKGQPIWFANEYASPHSPFHRRSGAYFWPGSEAAIHGQHLTHVKKYNSSVPLDARMDEVVDWFLDEEGPVNFAVLYYEQPDSAGHSIGPSNESLYDIITDIDTHLGKMMQKLQSFGLYDKLNVIITSDHGMVDIVGAKYLSDYLNTSWFDHYGHSPVFNILPKQGYHDKVYEALKKAGSELNVYLKEDIPTEYHYRYNRRIQPIVVSAPEGFELCVNKSSCEIIKGNHGYNNSLPSMHALFIGHGPAFRHGYKSPSFDSVDIYPLMCTILEIEIPYNNGNMDHVRHLLHEEDNSNVSLLTYVIVIAFVATVAGVMTVAALRIQHYQRHRQRLPADHSHFKSIFIHDQTDLDGHSHLLTSDDEEIH